MRRPSWSTCIYHGLINFPEYFREMTDFFWNMRWRYTCISLTRTKSYFTIYSTSCYVDSFCRSKTSKAYESRELYWCLKTFSIFFSRSLKKNVYTREATRMLFCHIKLINLDIIMIFTNWNHVEISLRYNMTRLLYQNRDI